MRKKKVIKNLKITGLSHRAKGVGRDDEGRVVFVEGAAPGDEVDVLILKKKKAFWEGNAIHFHEYSKDRVQPFCKYFGVCGGCKLQHISYENQLKYKQDIVENAIVRIGKIEVEDMQPILGCDKSTYYRNKLEYSFSNKRWLTREEIVSGVTKYEDVLGYHKSGAFDKILGIDHCYFQEDPSNLIRNTIHQIALRRELTYYDAREKTGFCRNVMLRFMTTGEIMMVMVVGENKPDVFKPFLDEIIQNFPQITSVYYSINEKVNDFMGDLDMVLYHGRGWIEEMLGDVRFRIGPKSFFQTNSRQAVRLFDVVKEFAALSGKENVYDLYTGIGSIALYLSKYCKQVVGIEEVEPAIKDAILNAQLNNIDNAVFYVGAVRNILNESFSEKHGKPDLVITDPPRAGMHQKVVDLLLELAAPKIVYVSCNPSTQARDLNLLNEKYDVVKMRPVDMFPHTHHIENVALLVLRK